MVAAPFDIIDRYDIRADQLTSSLDLPSDRDLVVTVDLRDIRDATDAEQRRNNVRTVILEVIDSDSIKSWLNRSKAFGLASMDRRRDSDVCGCSLVRLWASYVSSTCSPLVSKQFVA